MMNHRLNADRDYAPGFAPGRIRWVALKQGFGIPYLIPGTWFWDSREDREIALKHIELSYPGSKVFNSRKECLEYLNSAEGRRDEHGTG